MDHTIDKACCCSANPAAAANDQLPEPARPPIIKYILGIAAMLALWWLIYSQLEPFAGFFTHTLSQWTGFAPQGHLGSAVAFFVFETPKVLMLLTLVVFGVGIVRSFFTPERTRAILAGKRESVGNVLAALLGIVTPFCSCSAVPLFLGFVTTGVPLGVTFSFLISAPMVNEIALVLLYGLFGWKIAAIYLGTGLLHRHRRRLGHRAAENGTARRRLGLSNPGRQCRRWRMARRIGRHASATGSRPYAILSARSGFMSCWASPLARAFTATCPKG